MGWQQPPLLTERGTLAPADSCAPMLSCSHHHLPTPAAHLPNCRLQEDTTAASSSGKLSGEASGVMKLTCFTMYAASTVYAGQTCNGFDR